MLARLAHGPGQKRREVLLAAPALLGTGEQKGVHPMVHVDPPVHQGLQHREHRGHQVSAPLTARAMVSVAPQYAFAHAPLAGVVVHRDFGMGDKDGQSGPVGLQAGEHRPLTRGQLALAQRLVAALFHRR